MDIGKLERYVMENGISIVIPVYNEANNIVKTIEQIEQKIHTSREIIVIYDHDHDSTVPVVQEIISSGLIKSPIKLVKNNYGSGALYAIKTGFLYAQRKSILVVMADLADDLGCVDTMVNLLKDTCAVVCGSRYMRGGKQIGGPFIKSLMTRIAGLSLYMFTKIGTHDVTNSFKLYDTAVLRSLTIESSGGFELGMEITVKAFLVGYTITEVPTIWKARKDGVSRFKLVAWLPHYMRWYLLALFKGNRLVR